MSGRNDTPVLIVAGEDIIYGNIRTSSPIRLWAARDIVDFSFVAQNNSDDDISSVYAGRDIIAKPLPDNPSQSQAVSFRLYGPGNLVVEAGRNLGPFHTYGQNGGDITALGNAPNGASAARRTTLGRAG